MTVLRKTEAELFADDPNIKLFTREEMYRYLKVEYGIEKECIEDFWREEFGRVYDADKYFLKSDIGE